MCATRRATALGRSAGGKRREGGDSVGGECGGQRLREEGWGGMAAAAGVNAVDHCSTSLRWGGWGGGGGPRGHLTPPQPLPRSPAVVGRGSLRTHTKEKKNAASDRHIGIRRPARPAGLTARRQSPCWWRRRSGGGGTLRLSRPPPLHCSRGRKAAPSPLLRLFAVRPPLFSSCRHRRRCWREEVATQGGHSSGDRQSHCMP